MTELHTVPPFFIPIIAFALWAIALFSHLEILKLHLDVGEQLLSSLFLISYLILLLGWALSGPLTAVVLTALSGIAVLYLSLSAREASLLWQLVGYLGLFVAMVFYLYDAQKKASQKRIAVEKLEEELHLTREELLKKDLWKKSLLQKIDRLLDLQRFAEELRQLLGVEEAARKIVQETCQFLGKAQGCALYLVDAKMQELSLAAGIRRPQNAAVGGGEPKGTLFDHWVMKKCQSILVQDAPNDFRFPAETRSEAPAMMSVCASPLLSEKKVLGVIRANSAQKGAFTADDLRLLNILSNLGSVILRNNLLYEEMSDLAIRDGLTGLCLRRYFEEQFAERFEKAKESRSLVSVVLLDVDFFKRYNDEYGHSAGDLVLKSIAAIVLRCISPADLAARYGGEELVVLMPQRDKTQAMFLAETIRLQIERHRFLLRRIERRVTVSLGVASFPEDGQTPYELLATADKNLYQAKRSGRNRVCGDI